MKTTKTVLRELKAEHGQLSYYDLQIISELRAKRPKLHTLCRHVSRSGMFRLISVYWLRGSGRLYLDGIIERLGLEKCDKQRDGLRIYGCGMDMGFAVVYNLSQRIFPGGFRLHKGEWGRNGSTSRIDNDGGYALKQTWL